MRHDSLLDAAWAVARSVRLASIGLPCCRVGSGLDERFGCGAEWLVQKAPTAAGALVESFVCLFRDAFTGTDSTAMTRLLLARETSTHRARCPGKPGCKQGQRGGLWSDSGRAAHSSSMAGLRSFASPPLCKVGQPRATRRRTTPATPVSPVAKRTNEEGSGVTAVA